MADKLIDIGGGLQGVAHDNGDGTFALVIRVAGVSIDNATIDQSVVEARLGPVTETAPANDTASSALNGRLQRIAQNITGFFGVKTSTVAALGSGGSGAIGWLSQIWDVLAPIGALVSNGALVVKIIPDSNLVTLLSTASVTGGAEDWSTGDGLFVINGVWDGATATVEWTGDSGVTWLVLGSTALFTADSAVILTLPVGSVRVAIANAGGSTSLSAYAKHV